jgi:hypothetical protein
LIMIVFHSTITIVSIRTYLPMPSFCPHHPVYRKLYRLPVKKKRNIYIKEKSAAYL